MKATNRCGGRLGRWRQPLLPLRRGGWMWLLAALLLPFGARAQLTTSVTATGAYQYNSNVFDWQPGFEHIYDLSDSYYAYGAGLNLNDQISQQNVYLRGSDTEYDYDRFSQLTHSEYSLDGGWLWKIGQDVSGSIDVTRTRSMVPFIELISVALSVETDQRESASAGFLITPEWRIDFSGDRDHVLEPIPSLDEPNLTFNDTGGGALLRFLGGGEWVGNANFTYQHGDYSGANVVTATGAVGFFGPAYNQLTYSLGTTYSPAGQGAGVSTLDLAVGYTDRTSRYGLDDAAGTTGHLDYTRQLTGKTSVTLDLDRDVLSFITYAGSSLTNSAALSANWNATYKTSFNAGYALAYVQLPGQGPLGSTRGDHVQFASFQINYNALSWLAIRPYADYQTRGSNVYGANFNASIFGVSFLVQWPQLSGKAPQPALTLGMISY